MSKRSKSWLSVGLVAALLGGAACAALAGDDAPAKGKARHPRARAARQATTPRRGRAAEFLASLELTDEQRRLVADKARAAGPIVAAARQEARRILAQALAAAPSADGKPDRKAARASVRAELKALRGRVRGELAAPANEVVASLTPEQRAKLQAAAHAKKPLDDARLANLVGRLLLRPSK